MNGLLTIPEATAATIRMDKVESILNAAMSNDLGGFQPRRQSAQDIRGLAEILADLARRIDPIDSGDYGVAVDSQGQQFAISMKTPS